MISSLPKAILRRQDGAFLEEMSDGAERLGSLRGLAGDDSQIKLRHLCRISRGPEFSHEIHASR